MIPLVFWPIVLLVFSLGGHTDTYRTVAVGRGAFELCLPSLGILYQNSMLRFLIWDRTPLTKRTRGREAWVNHRGQDRSGRRLATLCPCDGASNTACTAS